MCVLCQKNTLEVLLCPAESKHNTQGAGYNRIADILEGFNTAGCLPRAINLSRFDDGEGIEATLRNTKPNGMILADFSLTNVQKREIGPQEMLDILTQAGLLVKV